MPDLQTLQATLSAALLSGELSAVAGRFCAGTADAEARLNIYRNNTLISLTECLKSVFPITEKLSDPRFFAYAAHEYIVKHPPKEARLSRYGADFPRFLSEFEPCRDFPIIAEMAALEWMISDSLNQKDEPAISLAFAAEAMARGGALCLSMQPNLRFVVSRWPILDVWLDHQQEHVTIRAPLRPRASRIAVITRGGDIQCLELDAARFAFWRSAAKGKCLEQAAIQSISRDRLFDLVRETVLLFRSGLVTGFYTSCHKEN
jgi:hypothetical protein